MICACVRACVRVCMVFALKGKLYYEDILLVEGYLNMLFCWFSRWTKSNSGHSFSSLNISTVIDLVLVVLPKGGKRTCSVNVPSKMRHVSRCPHYAAFFVENVLVDLFLL